MHVLRWSIVLAVLAALAPAAQAGAVAGCGEWQIVPSPNPADTTFSVLHGVAAVGPNEAWAVGQYLKEVGSGLDSFTLAMRWDGETWSIVPSPSRCTGAERIGVSC